MTTTETRPRVIPVPAPVVDTPGGAPTPHPTTAHAVTKIAPSGGATTSRRSASAGADSHPTLVTSTPEDRSSGGVQLAGRQERNGTRSGLAASVQPTDRQRTADTHATTAVGPEAGQDPAATGAPTTTTETLLDPALALAADVLDDLERVRIANANRLRILTTTEADEDGEQRGFGLDESHPDVARLSAIVDMLGKVEHDATLNLQRHMRRHPLHPWAKSMRGVGDKQVARLLAAIGDPYIRPEIVREDGTVVPSGPRTVSALWAYCGLHVLPAGGPRGSDTHGLSAAGRDRVGGDPGRGEGDTQTTAAGVAPKRARGQKANWSATAKTKAYLIALSCLKQLVKPCTGDAHTDDCACSPYRVVYDRRRVHTAETHPEWTDGHSHNDALRVSAKAILRDLWREAKRIHDQH